MLAALLGGFSTLYIMIESSSMVADFIYKLCTGLIMIIILCGKTAIKNYVYAVLTFMILSFSLSGISIFVAEKLNSKIVIASNLQQYIQISPIVLLFITAMVYVVVRTVQKQMQYSGKELNGELELQICGKVLICTALIDTGCCIKDPFGSSQVVVLDEKIFRNIKDFILPSEAKKRSRIIPVDTVGESSLLCGYRCDKAVLKCRNEKYVFDRIIAVASNNKLNENIDAIVSFDSIDRLSDGKSDGFVSEENYKLH